MFTAYTYPKPNMLVQQGTRVEIHGLTSAAGQKLNGCEGVAQTFFPHDDGRWSVLVDPPLEDGGSKKEYKIRIQNLQLTKISINIMIKLRENSGMDEQQWHDMTQGALLLAGTSHIAHMGTEPSILIFGHVGSPGFDDQALWEEASAMGLPRAVLQSFLDKMRRTKK